MIHLSTLVHALLRVLRTRMAPEEGATAVEYGIMVALIAAVIVGAVIVLGQEAEGEYDCTAQRIDNPAVVC